MKANWKRKNERNKNRGDGWTEDKNRIIIGKKWKKRVVHSCWFNIRNRTYFYQTQSQTILSLIGYRF